jgi:DNA-binding NarL/FixJ family response regulator
VKSVLLVEDHTAFRQALSLVLDLEPDLEVVRQAGSLAEARSSPLDGLDVAVVERTFSRIDHNRRMSKDYERLPARPAKHSST